MVAIAWLHACVTDGAVRLRATTVQQYPKSKNHIKPPPQQHKNAFKRVVARIFIVTDTNIWLKPKTALWLVFADCFHYVSTVKKRHAADLV